jgi:hypothetical protein
MNIHEVDWRIRPLKHVVGGINAALAGIEAQIGDPEWYDGLHACDDAEPLLGLGFVAFQTYALGTVQDLNRILTRHWKREKDKHKYYCCDPIVLKGGVTRMQLINAVANYFKHHDEWSRWPTLKDRGFNDAQVLARVGITEKTEHPCIEATNLLCCTSWNMIVVHQIVLEWRAHLINELA